MSEVVYTNFGGKFLDLAETDKSVLYDGDGTFSNNTSPSAIVRNFSHLKGEKDCINPSTDRWPGIFICNENATVRLIVF